MDSLVRQSRFVTFDGQVSATARHQRPDRYQHIELPGAETHRIARGGGYSYSAASFGKETLVQDMSCFNRFLDYDETNLVLTVEPGVTLADLLGWALPRGLYFPVMPGYPRITVGGCVAVDAHGKNPQKDGTFTRWVKGLTVYHPDKGYQECAPDYDPVLFELTCGGFGLTGVITRVSLQLIPLPATHLLMNERPVGSLADAIDALAAADADIAYTWHDLCPGEGFGRGIVHCGHWETPAGDEQPRAPVPDYTVMTAASRARWPVGLWNRWSARAANAALLWLSGQRKASTPTDVFSASFPFARNRYFHTFFGRSGFHELQLLLSHEQVKPFVQALERLVQAEQAPTMMGSIKAFQGQATALSMSGAGYVVTLVCHRSRHVDTFLEAVDGLAREYGGQPNLAKDSRVTQSLAAYTLPHYTSFRERLLAYDERRVMRSELSDRLGLQ